MCYKAVVPNVIDLPRSADVVIIGGGFAGMSTAQALAARGIRDVIVLERESQLGRYASGRAAGLGRQLAEDDALTALTVRGAALLRTRFPQAWTASGGVLSFDNADHAQAYVDRAARFGVDIEPMSRELVLGHWPALEAVQMTSALFVPSDGVIDVGALLAALSAGIDVALSTAVTAVEPLSGGARVQTSRGEIVARIVVDAAGAWAGQAVGEPPLSSLKRHIYVVDAVPSAGSPYVWHLGACELYVRTFGEATLVSPCDATAVPAGHQEPDPDGELKLRRALVGSPLAGAAITRAWACQRTFAPDGAMKLGRDGARDYLVWAAGLGGHGATAAPAVGESVADAVARIL